MQRIDAHQHFWKYNPTQYPWINDQMGLLKKDFMPEDLIPLLQNAHLDGCVAVQACQDESDNEFLLQLAEQYDFIKGVVGWVDLRASQLPQRLEYYGQFPKMKGFRHIIHDEPDIDFMLRPDLIKGVATLQCFGYTYDILIFAKHLPNTVKFIKALPDDLPLVIDHIAKPNIQNREIEIWQKHIKVIAQHKNLYCKISGMTTEARWRNWKKEDFTPYLDAVVEAFGTNRLIYGSDWPVCLLAANYDQQFNIVKEYFSDFSPTEQVKFFGENAIKFYDLK
ncbi:MAG: amidohydrolase family protein [Runella sp.]